MIELNSCLTCCFSSSFRGKIISYTDVCVVVRTATCDLELFFNLSTRFFQLNRRSGDGFDIYKSIEKIDLLEMVNRPVVGKLIIYSAGKNLPKQKNICTELYFQSSELDDPPYMFPAYWVNVSKNLASWWMRHSIDSAEGGYFTYIDSKGEVPSEPELSEKWSYIISRTVYGLATSFLLTGNEEFFKSAKTGIDFLFDHALFTKQGYTLFHTCLEKNGRCHSNEPEYLNIFSQIYSLTGLAAYYEITRCGYTAKIIDEILRSLDMLYYDTEHGGFYDAISGTSLKPIEGVTDSKSFNSIVDPLSAALFSLYNSNFKSKYVDLKKLILHLTELICRHFICYNNSFIYEVFNRKWEFTKPRWYNQYNAPFESGNVGGCLKVIWVLLRAMDLQSNENKKVTMSGIEHLQHNMESSGSWDAFRGGWFKYMKRQTEPGSLAEHMYHTHKVWWQQQEGIVSNLLMYLVTKDKMQLDCAMGGIEFWLTFFIDSINGGVFHTVSIDGLPVKADKGGPFKSAYHETELAKYAYLYFSIMRHHSIDFYYIGQCPEGEPSPLSIPALAPGLTWQAIAQKQVNDKTFRIRYKPVWYNSNDCGDKNDYTEISDSIR